MLSASLNSTLIRLRDQSDSLFMGRQRSPLSHTNPLQTCTGYYLENPCLSGFCIQTNKGRYVESIWAHDVSNDSCQEHISLSHRRLQDTAAQIVRIQSGICQAGLLNVGWAPPRRASGHSKLPTEPAN